MMTNQQTTPNFNVRTRVACVLILITGLVLHFVATYFAFRPKLPVASAANYIHVAYLVLTPVALAFLPGEKRWRLAVLGIWLAYVGFLAYTIWTMG